MVAALRKASGAAILFLLLGSTASGVVAAQPASTANSPKTSTALTVIAAGVAAVIVAVFLLSALFCIVGPRFFGVDDGGGGGRRQAPSGLSREVVEGFPTYLYEHIKVHRRESRGKLECAICLSEFQDDETLRILPECDHAFHPQCIDPWLLSQATCPICRRVLDASIDVEQIANEPDASDVDARDHHITIINPLPPVRTPARDGPGHQGPSEPELTTDQIQALFSKPHSTGHSPVWTVGQEDRFTLRLPKEARMKIAGLKVPRGGSWNERR